MTLRFLHQQEKVLSDLQQPRPAKIAAFDHIRDRLMKGAFYVSSLYGPHQVHDHPGTRSGRCHHHLEDPKT